MSNHADEIGTRRNGPGLRSGVPEAPSWWRQAADLIGLTKPKALVVYALLIVSAGTLAYAALASREAAFSVRHTVEVRETTRQLLSLLADAETAQRGFLITRDGGYLQPYVAALPAIETTIGQLRALIADNPSQLARFIRLPPLIRVKLAELADTIARVRAGRADDAMAVVRLGGGKIQMDEIRSIVADMVAEETRLLQAREVTWRVLGTTLLFSILACLVAAFTYGLLQLRLPVAAVEPAHGPVMATGIEPIAVGWPRIVGFATITLGSLVLLGWLFDIRLLKVVLPGAVTMKANAAISFILAGTVLVAACAGYARLTTVCAGAVALIGATTLVEYFFDHGIGIDQLVFRDPEGAYPGRMAPLTAAAFLCIGVAILMPSRVRLVLGLGVLLISTLAVLGYLYGFDALYRIAPYTGMAVHTAVGLVLLASALLVGDTAAPAIGWERVLRTPTAWLIAGIIGILLLIGSATSHVITSGLMEPAPALAIATLVSLPLIGGALWGSVDALENARQRTIESERRLRLFVEGAPNAMLMVDQQGRILQVNSQTEVLFGYGRDELLDKPVEMLVPEQVRSQHPALRFDFLRAATARPMGVGRDLFGVRKDGSEIPIEIGLNPLSVGADTVVLAAIADITERKLREERTEFLSRELMHRTKNLMTIIQAIARQTASSAESVNEFENRLSARIQGLSISQNLLVKQDWRGAAIADVVNQHLAPFADLEHRTIEGPHVLLKPAAVENLGLAFHELATNSAKYGALSTPEGKVGVHWQFVGSKNGNKCLRIAWQEHGGPPVQPVKRKGFGYAVIHDVVASALDAEVTLDFAPEGVRWTIEVPVSYLLLARLHQDVASGIP